MYSNTMVHIFRRTRSNPESLMDARESREDFCESLFRAQAKLSPNLHFDDVGGDDYDGDHTDICSDD